MYLLNCFDGKNDDDTGKVCLLRSVCIVTRKIVFANAGENGIFHYAFLYVKVVKFHNEMITETTKEYGSDLGFFQQYFLSGELCNPVDFYCKFEPPINAFLTLFFVKKRLLLV
mmetsp:Transcript_8349/g.18227  ORF Transcript_8349/g.18227 Transcript_8349/m.18227 type:complete len:113 (-) Transcript_8349:110-448(-)